MSERSRDELEELRGRVHALLQPQPKVTEGTQFVQKAAKTLAEIDDFLCHIERAVQGILLGSVIFPYMRMKWELLKRDVTKIEAVVSTKSTKPPSCSWLVQFFESHKCTFTNYLFLIVCTERHENLGMKNDKKAALMYSMSAVLIV